MSKRDYERLPIENFGRHLIVSGDLDPVYIALHRIDWDLDEKKRFLVAYWCWYHCGTAAYLSCFEGKEFWHKMQEAARNTTEAPNGGRWPRGHERRHARGEQAMRMVWDLEDRYRKPEEMINVLTKPGFDGLAVGPLPFELVADRVQKHVLFGPWIAFKIADMIDRCLGVKVDFTEAAVFMFKDPVKAALMLWRKKHQLPESSRPKDQAAVIHEVVGYLTRQFSDLKAPPLGDRPIGLQEVETVLCKWKSHMNGHYPLFNDTREIRAGLPGWGGAAEHFLDAMPEVDDEA